MKTNGNTWEIFKNIFQNINVSVIAIVTGFVLMHVASLWSDNEKMKLAKCDANGTVRIQFFDGGTYTCQPLAQSSIVKPKSVITK